MSQIRFPTELKLSHCLGGGLTGMVYLEETSNTVIKVPHEGGEPAIEVERQIYERFQQHGGHEGLLQYYGTAELSLRLEYMSLHNLRQYLQIHPEIDTQQRLQWSEQVASALVFVHSMNVIHADLTCNNVCLDDNQNAKLIDFGGSSLDGSYPLISVTASHMWPGDDDTSTQIDLFALGSALYEIWTGKPPFQGRGLSNLEITDSFKRFEFPETESLGPIGDVIRGCWQGKFACADDALEAIKLCNRASIITSIVDLVFASCIRETIITVSFLSIVLLLVHKLARR